MPRKSTRSGKAPRKRVVNDQYYVVLITSWDWDYSFGINKTKFQSDPYDDFRHLEIVGNLLKPKSVKADSVRLVFMPDYDLDKNNRQRRQPTGVGFLDLYRRTLNGLFPIPADALNPILTMLVADRMKFVVIHGDRLRFRKATARHFRICTSLEDGDLPEDD